jgi:hypothetical protein
MAVPVHGLLERILATAKTALFRSDRNVVPSLAAPIQIFLQYRHGLLTKRPSSDHPPYPNIPDPRRHHRISPRQILPDQLDQIQNQKTFQHRNLNTRVGHAPQQDSHDREVLVHATLPKKLPSKRLQDHHLPIHMHFPTPLAFLWGYLYRNWIFLDQD